MHSLLCSVIAILVVATCGRAQIPPRNCKSTGVSCVEQCPPSSNSQYQWCGSCSYYIKCTNGLISYNQCPEGLVWNDNAKTCAGSSSTCNECDIPIPLCQSTGPICINDCLGTPDYIYQYCGRCDYFIQCSGGVTFFTACQQSYLKYDDNFKACGRNSSTCKDDPCAIDLPGDHCSSNPCLNGGTCQEQSDGYVCSCRPGYTGTDCNTITDNCLSNPCVNGGTCHNDINLWTCTCAPGYTETNCGSITDNCLSSPCLNGGTCHNDVDLWTCTCDSGYTGTNCGSIDACSSSPCLNGATCEADYGSGSYQCICVTDYTGTDCETYIGGCNPSPCMNGATCIPDGTGDSSCACPIEWTGRLCESPNYVINASCGDIVWTGYPPKNGFTVFCYYTASSSDVAGRSKECRQVLTGLPIWNDAEGLMNAGGNFGCIVSLNFPGDLDATSYLSCADDYQQNVSLGNTTENAKLMACIRYPYPGIPLRGLS